MKACDKAEHTFIDQLIDNGSCPAGHTDYTVVLELYRYNKVKRFKDALIIWNIFITQEGTDLFRCAH